MLGGLHILFDVGKNVTFRIIPLVFTTLEFSLNVFTEFAEFSDKNIIILKRRARTHYLLCKRQGFYQWSTETQLTEKTVKLILIHASVIPQIP